MGPNLITPVTNVPAFNHMLSIFTEAYLLYHQHTNKHVFVQKEC